MWGCGLASPGNNIAVTDGRFGLTVSTSHVHLSLPQGGVSNRQVGSPPAGPTKLTKSALSAKLSQNFRNFDLAMGDLGAAQSFDRKFSGS